MVDEKAPVQTVYRWDLDKTYLDTDFHTIRGLVRTATEPAHRKRALPGATELLRALSERPRSLVMVISGSPTQMHGVLREKLALDGVRIDDLVLKDNLGNVRRGRLRALRGQLGYKLPALFAARAQTEPMASEMLFGDDVESDALTYSVYADAICGRIGAAEVSRIMELAGAYPDDIDGALASLVQIQAGPVVERIFIRQEHGVPVQRLAALGPRVVPIRSWWQAALVLFELEHLGSDALQAVMKAVYGRNGKNAWAMAALAQDMLRRGRVTETTVLGIRGPAELEKALQLAVASLRGHGIDVEHNFDQRIDYLSLLRSDDWSAAGRAKR